MLQTYRSTHNLTNDTFPSTNNKSYKSLICFLTCWIVIPLGEPFKFTKWGIVSGLFWVPGATAGIYGIRNAGLAISVGTWSSLIVVSSFCWGIFVFDEKVKSIAGAGGAAIVLICGLVGMSVFSSPPANVKDDTNTVSKVKTEERKSDEEDVVPLLEHSGNSHKGSDSDYSSEDEMIELTNIDNLRDSHLNHVPQSTNRPVSRPGRITRRKKGDAKKSTDQEDDDKSRTKLKEGNDNDNDKIDEEKEDDFNFFGGEVRLSKRQMGILGAVINGVWGGNCMIPLHYARYEFKLSRDGKNLFFVHC